MNGLTPLQREAVERLDENVLVSAGAGSGKTRVLVERLIEILIQGEARPKLKIESVQRREVGGQARPNLQVAKGQPSVVGGQARPEEVLAITFTEKAANEVKWRVRERLREMGRYDLRQGIEASAISTIHSFCARILKENALEAGVDPEFRILEPEQEQELRGLFLTEIFEECWEKEGFQSPVIQILGEYGEERVRTGVLDLHDQLKMEGQDARDFVEAQADRVPAVSKEALAEIVTGLETRLERFKEEKGYLDFQDLLIQAERLLRGESPLAQQVLERLGREFRFILVDEYQDTDRLQDAMVQRLAERGNLFIVGDVKQSIYGFRNARVEIFQAEERNFSGLRLRLSENFRSRPEIIAFVNFLFSKIWGRSTDALSPPRQARPNLQVAKGQPSVVGGQARPNLQVAKGQPSVVGGQGARDHPCEQLVYEPLVAKLNDFSPKDFPSVEVIIEQKEEDKEAGEEGEEMGEARIREACQIAARIRGLVDRGEISVRETHPSGEVSFRKVRYGDIAILFRAMGSVAIYERELHLLGIPYFTVSGQGYYEKFEVLDVVRLFQVVLNPLAEIPLAAVLKSPFVGVSDDTLYWLKENARRNGTRLCEALERCSEIEELEPTEREKLSCFRDLLRELIRDKDRMSITELLEKVVTRSRYEAKLLMEDHGKRRFANLEKLLEMTRGFEAGGFFTVSHWVDFIEKLALREAKESEAQTEAEKGNVVKLLSIHTAKGLEFPVVIVADLGRERRPPRGVFSYSKEWGLGVKLREEGEARSRPKWRASPAMQQFEEAEEQREREEEKRLFYVACTRAKEHLILSGVAKFGKKSRKQPFARATSWMDALRIFLDLEENPEQSQFIRVYSGETGDEKVRVAFSYSDQKSNGRSFWSPLRRFADRPTIRKALASGSPIPEKVLRRIRKKTSPVLDEEIEAVLERTRFVPRPYYETIELPVTALERYRHCPKSYFYNYEMGYPDLPITQSLAPTGGEGSLPAALPPPTIWRTGPPKSPGCEGATFSGWRAGASRQNQAGARGPGKGEQPVSARGGLERDTEEELDAEESSPREFGILVHSCLERLNFKKEVGPQIEKFKRENQGRWSREKLQALSQAVGRFARTEIARELKHALRLYRELPFLYRRGQAVFRGVVDLLYQDVKRQWVLVDYKTSEIEKTGVGEEAKKYEFQMALYALAVREALGQFPDQTFLYFTTPGVAYPLRWKESDWSEVTAFVEKAVEGILANEFPLNRGAHCEACPFKTVCFRDYP